jgi:phage recombination protein Bet
MSILPVPARQESKSAYVGSTGLLYDKKTLDLIWRTVAKDCNPDEFNLFLNYCRRLNLDPLRRQIYAFVFSKDDAAKRNMSVVTAITGFRAIAERTGNYRPDEDGPTYAYDEAAKNPDTNPLGLVSASVRVWKHSHGAWHKVTETAFWEEYAPIKESAAEYEWVETGEFYADTGKPKRRKKAIGEVRARLDTSGQWGKMPRLMLAKVAESLALRKAWPDDFANLYAEEELDRARVMLDVTPAEAAEQGAVESRLESAGLANGIAMTWSDPNAPLESVPLGTMADRCLAFIRENAAEPSVLRIWSERNRVGLREFWARAKGDALEVRKAMESALEAAEREQGE